MKKKDQRSLVRAACLSEKLMTNLIDYRLFIVGVMSILSVVSKS